MNLKNNSHSTCYIHISISTPLYRVVPNTKKLLMCEHHADNRQQIYQWKKRKHENTGHVKSTNSRKLCNLPREETFDTYVLS